MLPAVWSCLWRFALYILPVAALLFFIHDILPVPREFFRKLLHGAAFTSTPIIMWISKDWRVAVLTLFIVGLAVWPILAVAERYPRYADLLIERRQHEVRRSMLLLFWGNAALVALCWGLWGKPEIASTAILMWGPGDAAAALIGKRWGRHHTGLPFADPKKTWEGTIAMCVTSTTMGAICRVLGGGFSLPAALCSSIVAALAGSYVELITKRGYDTITVPFAIAAVLRVLTLTFFE